MQIKKFTPLLVALALTACGGETSTTEEVKEEPAAVEETEKEPQDEETQPEVAEETEVEEKEDDVPREYKSALKAAENYISSMPFSEKGLYDQLTAEYGNKYPAEAAQYAIDNIEVDYNEQALRAAKNYQETMPMSDAELKDQLMSEYGDKYTEEQAQYAIDNIEQ